jgi:hypothetical protein
MRNVDAVSLPMSSNEEVNPCLEQGRLFAIRNRMVGVEPALPKRVREVRRTFGESGSCPILLEIIVQCLYKYYDIRHHFRTRHIPDFTIENSES